MNHRRSQIQREELNNKIERRELMIHDDMTCNFKAIIIKKINNKMMKKLCVE
jgi:hypothetical protein